MERRVKRFISALVLLLILLHGAVLFLFFGPLAGVIRFAGVKANMLSMVEIPVTVQQAFASESNALVLPEPKHFFQRLNRAILRVRFERMMDETQKQAFILSVLPFGADVFGVQKGANYYFKKPLDQLSEQEALHLAAFYRVFWE